MATEIKGIVNNEIEMARVDIRGTQWGPEIEVNYMTKIESDAKKLDKYLKNKEIESNFESWTENGPFVVKGHIYTNGREELAKTLLHDLGREGFRLRSENLKPKNTGKTAGDALPGDYGYMH